ncbi:uncharacterized protein Pyn_23038 [Prunus yedoensis var. nudiflora]|uniref:Uncharacterized protein n=1 Tax=Prunus yedoensis var. nudiflora TaxID=2094558 RepID=A0A314UXR2_PRUYE|nr:uncharacterized protein Pyn_23038 [Prunus yedoensis var. nudiflora]
MVPARGGQKRRVDESLPLDTGKRCAEGEPRRDIGKRPASASVPETGKRTSVDPVTGLLEP